MLKFNSKRAYMSREMVNHMSIETNIITTNLDTKPVIGLVTEPATEE